ncbi:segregation/condensation protein A [Geobacter hydrogenophilus]|uniref:Segregation and condensation protein A n=1 Tax=Geobacter hydrogenophilus TaxID=40983 RepID=A0A9W6LCS3_9BACT|nr:segregation/condensation protein A [Geobacter hydrogenophilus]MBT0892972.1 segregation/condensation protein A [Geobacter hydrogenophilus]GLI39192.1 segregation and condensation protein A [Geobacter hydrogenophilus]
MSNGGNLDLYQDEESSSYTVKLEVFEGPLDLLLHLIRKNEVDIYDIPLSIITKEYLEYIKMMKELNLEIAGEFLVMASTLIQIKSKTLLPTPADEDAAEEEEEDPRAELVRRLLEYQKYKDAALSLTGRDMLGRDTYARSFISPELAEMLPEEEPVEVELFELIEAFRKVLDRVSEESFHEVGAESITIAERINEILSLLEGKESLLFDELFPEHFNRDFLIATFLAVLELCKLKMVKVVQANRYGSIWIQPAVMEGEGSLVDAES